MKNSITNQALWKPTWGKDRYGGMLHIHGSDTTWFQMPYWTSLKYARLHGHFWWTSSSSMLQCLQAESTWKEQFSSLVCSFIPAWQKSRIERYFQIKTPLKTHEELFAHYNVGAMNVAKIVNWKYPSRSKVVFARHFVVHPLPTVIG